MNNPLPSSTSLEVDVSQTANTAVYQVIPPVAIGLSILYLLFGISHILLLPPSIARIMASVALGTAVTFLTLYLLLKRFPLPIHWTYPLAFTIYAFVLLNSILHLYLTKDPRQSTNVMLAFIGAGFFFLNHRWLFLTTGVTLGLWTAVIWVLPPSPDKLHFGFAMGTAVVLALLLRTTRLRNLEHLEQLRLLSEQQADELATAVYNTQKQLLARQQSDEKFKKAFQLNPIPMTMTTLVEGKYIDVNDSFLRLFGFTRDEVIDHSAYDLNIWVDIAERQKFTQELQEKNTIIAAPFTLQTKLSKAVDILSYAEIFYVESIPVILALSYNITDQKRATNDLRESEQKFRQLYNKAQRQKLEMELMQQVHVALARELDLSALIYTVVEATAATFGYPLVSVYLLEGNRLYLQHQVGYDEVITDFPISEGIAGRVVQTQRPILVEDAHTDPAFLFAISGISSEVCVPLFDNDQVAGVLILESTTERLSEDDLRLMITLSEQVNIAISRAGLHTQIRASEERYRTLVEQLPIGVYRNTPGEHGRFLMVNPAFVKMFGFANEQAVLQHRVSDLYIHPSERQIFSDMVLVEGSVQGYEIGLKRQDGTTLWGSVTARVVSDADGRPLYFDCTIEDITERKRTEEVLLQTQKLESLGVLAGGIAHDFNNLLMAMMTQNDLALMLLDSQHRARDPIEKALKAAERAADLTQKMLAYSGKGQFQIHPISLNELIEENIHLFEVAIPKQITLHKQLVADLPLIEADAGQIQQVVMNLIINGVEAMEEQSGELFIRTSVDDVNEDKDYQWYNPTNPLAPGEYAVLEVQDQGTGMDTGILGKIFDPFFTTKFTGRGLGLAAVLGIIHGHKGNLQVHSRLGRGTTFKVYFPISYKSASLTHTPQAKPPLILPANGMVLVIDDEDPVREAITDILQTIDVNVITATTSFEGIDLFVANQDHIKLVILDLSMPGIDGQETLVRLQEINANIPVILSSGFNQTEINHKLTNLGHADFLKKPYNVNELLNIVQKHLT